MESTEKLYIISFGDSAKFRIKCADSKEELEKSKKLVDFENSLNSFLKEKFPAGNYTFYTTPAITEVYPEDAAKYDSYPERPLFRRQPKRRLRASGLPKLSDGVIS